MGITKNQTVECTVTYEVSLGWGWECAGGGGGRVEGLVAFSVGIYLDKKPLNQCEYGKITIITLTKCWEGKKIGYTYLDRD